MSQKARFLSVVCLLGLALPEARAEEAQELREPAGHPLHDIAAEVRAREGQELRELLLTVQEQSKQIETLVQQVGKLTQILEAQKTTAVSPKTEELKEPAAAPKEPVAAVPPKPENTPSADAVPKAEAALMPKHTVVKGETLTSIAKHSNIPLADLQKANKIEDGRKLQIGQTLIIPTPTTPEPATEKKEKP